MFDFNFDKNTVYGILSFHHVNLGYKILFITENTELYLILNYLNQSIKNLQSHFRKLNGKST
jgi:hypothetical protein